nr:unnamed protein product [Callosobruchus analis]
MTIFYTILNIVAINAHILYGCYKNHQNIDRKKFTKLLARQLAESYLNIRLYNSRIPRELRLNIGRVLNKQLPIEESRSIQNQKRRRCVICERKNDKKTKISCNKCERPMCGDCRAYICKNCV